MISNDGVISNKLLFFFLVLVDGNCFAHMVNSMVNNLPFDWNVEKFVVFSPHTLLLYFVDMTACGVSDTLFFYLSSFFCVRRSEGCEKIEGASKYRYEIEAQGKWKWHSKGKKGGGKE